MSARGLYGKYIVTKADGSPVAPDADYFVLRLDTDKIARNALLLYSENVAPTNPELARDIRQRCNEYAIREWQKPEPTTASTRTKCPPDCLCAAGEDPGDGCFGCPVYIEYSKTGTP